MDKKIIYWWSDVVVCLKKKVVYLVEDNYSKMHVSCEGCAKSELCQSIREVIDKDRTKK